ncbi:OPT superfamily [Basidiobolus ranarum]|uniref:OPT superfamily n=1 Tax=Basidiobolus ranarum TaxID=34480 RepID=A0ABR2WC34_9FUNG
MPTVEYQRLGLEEDLLNNSSTLDDSFTLATERQDGNNQRIALSLIDPSNDESNLPHFTFRAVFVGLIIGSALCFSNMYFGLQTGWISMMSLQSSLLGFVLFRLFRNWQQIQFGVAENVILQTTAVATATMPLAGGIFVLNLVCLLSDT